MWKTRTALGRVFGAVAQSILNCIQITIVRVDRTESVRDKCDSCVPAGVGLDRSKGKCNSKCVHNPFRTELQSYWIEIDKLGNCCCNVYNNM